MLAEQKAAEPLGYPTTTDHGLDHEPADVLQRLLNIPMLRLWDTTQSCEHKRDPGEFLPDPVVYFCCEMLRFVHGRAPQPLPNGAVTMGWLRLIRVRRFHALHSHI